MSSNFFKLEVWYFIDWLTAYVSRKTSSKTTSFQPWLCWQMTNPPLNGEITLKLTICAYYVFHSSIFWKDIKKSQNFQFLPFRSKKISPGRFKKYLAQRLVSLLFNVGERYAQVQSGPSLLYIIQIPLQENCLQIQMVARDFL